jgi:hypothetical protein
MLSIFLSTPLSAEAAGGVRAARRSARAKRAAVTSVQSTSGNAGGEGRGGTRGRNLHMFSFAASLIYKMQFPAAEVKEGNEKVITFTDEDIRYICTMKRMLTADTGEDTVDWLASRIAFLTKRDEKRVASILKDGTACTGKPATSRPNR